MKQFCYRNLRTKKWQVNDKPKTSAQAPQLETLAMRDVTFRVSEKVRLWCVAHAMPSGKPYRQVHAFAVGEVISARELPGGERVQVSYNPAKSGSFYRCDTGAAVTWCEYLEFDSRGAWAVGGIR